MRLAVIGTATHAWVGVRTCDDAVSPKFWASSPTTSSVFRWYVRENIGTFSHNRWLCMRLLVGLQSDWVIISLRQSSVTWIRTILWKLDHQIIFNLKSMRISPHVQFAKLVVICRNFSQNWKIGTAFWCIVEWGPRLSNGCTNSPQIANLELFKIFRPLSTRLWSAFSSS